MTWLLFLILNIIAYSITVILQRVLIKASSSRPIAYTIFFQLFTGIFITMIALLLHLITFPKITLLLGIDLTIAAFLYAFANLFIFKALKTTEASKFTVIYSARVFFTILASTLLLGEFLTIQQSIGAILIFIGILIINVKTKKITLNKGDMYSLIAAVLFGFANSDAKYILHSFSIFPYMIFVFFVPSVLLAIIYPQEIKYVKIFLEKKLLASICLLAVVYGLANIGFFEALKFGPSSSLVTTIQLLSVLCTVGLSILFLKERTNLGQKLLGTIISLSGLILIIR